MKIIEMPFRRMNSKERKIVEVSDELDSVILKHLSEGNIEVSDLTCLLSHRLGTLLSHIDRKQELWRICADIVKKRAEVS